MKLVSGSYVENFITARRFAMGELYVITLIGGDVDRFTNLDFNVAYGGHTYRGDSILIEGLKLKASVGLSVDEQDVKIMFRPEDTLAGAVFSQAVSEGLLDGARLDRLRAFWKSQNAVAINDFTSSPDDVVTLFSGFVSTIDKIGRTSVEMKVRSPLALLDLDMPRNNYQSGCQWSLFDTGCTLNRADFTFSGTVEALIGDYGIQVSGGIPTAIGLDGDTYYGQGRIHFTSGNREGLQLSIRYNDDNNIYFMYPPIIGLQPGDTFEAWPGCSKRTDTCLKKFDNLNNFRGFPRVPPIHISV